MVFFDCIGAENWSASYRYVSFWMVNYIEMGHPYLDNVILSTIENETYLRLYDASCTKPLYISLLLLLL